MKKQTDKNIKEEILKDELLQEILPVLKNCDAYLVGGYVRDLFLYKTTNDRDIAVFNSSAKELAMEIQKKINGYR